MEKVIVPPATREMGKIYYNGVNIEINPYISITDEISWIGDYVERYFNPMEIVSEDSIFKYMKYGNYDYWRAEYALIQTIMENMTNVDTGQDKTNADEMVELFYKVVSKIDNYYQFRDRLDETIQAIKDSKSIGIVIDNLVSNATELFESFKSIDHQKIKDLADTVIQKVENSPVSGVFTEAKGQAQIDKRVKNNKKSKESKVE